MLRIIDNKKVDLTDAEYKLYQDICKSYDSAHVNGRDLFIDLFETDQNGIIVFLRPPKSKFSSMEVYMFLVGVMIHQHLGVACDHVDKLATRMDEKEKDLDKKMSELNKMLDKGEKLIKTQQEILNAQLNRSRRPFA